MYKCMPIPLSLVIKPLVAEIQWSDSSSSYWTSQWLAWENQENSKIQRELFSQGK